jgi:hypothetical protein
MNKTENETLKFWHKYEYGITTHHIETSSKGLGNLHTLQNLFCRISRISQDGFIILTIIYFIKKCDINGILLLLFQ